MGNQLLSADARANTTLDGILNPIRLEFDHARTPYELEEAIYKLLPLDIARLVAHRLVTRDVDVTTDLLGNKKDRVKSELLDIVRENFGDRRHIMRPMLHKTRLTDKDVDTSYYTREDLFAWANDVDPWDGCFQVQDEYFTINVSGIADETRTMLSGDQLVGICYALDSILKQDARVTILSSVIDDKEINYHDIVNNYLKYKLLPVDPVGKHYTINIIQDKGEPLTVYFDNAEFMQGILSVASWYQLQDGGKEIFWTNLLQSTVDGLIPVQVIKKTT